MDDSGLPAGARQLLALATAVPERAGAARDDRRTGWVEQVGEATVESYRDSIRFVTFVGEATIAMVNVVRGRAKVRGRDFALFVEEASAGSLPIVTLINFLMGVILAFVGALQLQQFGATIYVVNLVGVGMTREMAAMMTGIVMAGRTGAAYAAQLGTMTVNEEIDALKTLGVSPMEFLVLPRMLALALMMPILTLYGDFMGILGGAFVTRTMFDISFVQYVEQARGALSIKGFALGLFKAGVYGVLVAIAGCYQGMRSGRSAAAVGDATTRAVVMALVMIIVSSAVLTVIYSVLGL